MRFVVFLCSVLFLTAPCFAGDAVVINTKTGKQTVNAEIADTPETRRLGLMFRKFLPENDGMLFLFGENRDLSMWMKNTYLPLDMVFIDENGVVKCLAKNAEPMTLTHISCDEKTAAVLEINAGKIDEWGVFKGDTVTHKAFKNDRKRL